MTMASASPVPAAPEDPWLRRWIVAAAAVLLAHAGLVLWILYRQNAPAAGEPPAAVMVELAPMAVAPPVETPVELAPGPQMTEAEPEEVEEELVEAKLAPELPPAPNPVAVLAPPPKPKPKPIKKVVKKVHKPDHKPPAPKTTAPARTQARQGRTSAAPRQGSAGSRASLASWHSRVGAHIGRHVHYPEAARPQVGTPALSFTLNQSGRVLSARVVRSSGSGALDREAVAAAYRASPFPSAPSEIGGGPFSFTVPIHFHMR
jgi:protein TonB